MRYGSICSGVAPQTKVWSALGLDCAWFAEIEDFPSAVLKHRYPEIPNLGDFTKIGKEHGPVDLLVGGTPCQSFSVAGLRGGLDDARGNLTLEFGRLAGRLRPRWLAWENVPGVMSIDEGRTFGAFLGLLAGRKFEVPSNGWGNSGVFEGYRSAYGVAYRILDAQYTGVPQRRRRVFVVGHLGDWRRAAAVLFERHSLSGHPAPRREKRESVTGTIGARASAGGGFGGDFETTGGLQPVTFIPEVVGTLSDGAHMGGGLNGQDAYSGRIIPTVTHALRADGFDASEDGTGRGTPLVPTLYSIMPMNSGKDYKAREVEVSQPVMAGGPVGGNQGGDVVVAFSAKDHGADATEPMSYRTAGDGAVYDEGESTAPLTTATDPSANVLLYQIQSVNMVRERKQNGIGISESDAMYTVTGRDQHAVAFEPRYYADGRLRPGGAPSETVATLKHSPKAGDTAPHVATNMAVRRLTPRECERLQGFEDGWTDVPYKGKRAADGNRYKAIGNSWAVPVLNWIGERIVAVDRFPRLDQIQEGQIATSGTPQVLTSDDTSHADRGQKTHGGSTDGY